jgi:hypothetical protein
MALSKLTTKTPAGVKYLDERPSLYYNKYNYRLRLYYHGISLSYYCTSKEALENKVFEYRERWGGLNIEPIVKFVEWRTKLIKGTATIRIENDTASIFFNDFAVVRELENTGARFDYTEISNTVPVGVKYFDREPKFKYRLYFKSKKVKDNFADDLRDFVKRYENTTSPFKPSKSLHEWYQEDHPIPPGRASSLYGNTGWGWNNNWKRQFLSSHFFLEYNQESMLTIFSLNFSGVVSKILKLEKRPDPV